MDLHTFNKSLLGSIGIIDETGEGHLSRLNSTGDNSSPWTIGGKRVVLPTNENLRKPEDNTIVFHPLSENITRSESDVLKAMRDQIMYSLTIRSVTLLTELARVAATDSEHKRLDAASQKYLKKLGDFDTRSYEFVTNAIKRVGPEPEKRLVSISLRKGNQADGILRRASFKWPVLDTVMGDAPDLLGVKYPSKKVRPAIRSLFETVMGDADTREAMNYGSKNLVAPYFDALMNAFFNMASHLNQVTETHRKLLGDDLADHLLFDLSWYAGMDNLADMRKRVPPQEGNEGALIVGQVQEKAPANPAAAIAPPRERETVAREKIDVPWEESSDRTAEPQKPHQRPSAVPRKSLDEALADQRAGRRDERDDRRDDRYRDDRYRDDRRYDDRDRDRYYRDDRRDTRDSRDYRRDERDDRGVRRRVIDLGLGSSRDDRDYRDDRRDYRDSGPRRSFGEGQRNMRW